MTGDDDDLAEKVYGKDDGDGKLSSESHVTWAPSKFRARKFWQLGRNEFKSIVGSTSPGKKRNESSFSVVPWGPLR